ncbi:MAG: transketolase, partial [Anaerolineales bacterium]
MEERKYSKEELIEAACEMRALNLISIHAARSGHPGGTLSIMDITAALFLNEARLDPKNPKWEDRDRIFFSTGHKAPAIYVALAKAGMYTEEEVVTLRRIWSPFQGHPHAPKLPGVEISSGSLGQGLSIAVGSALAAHLNDKSYRVYCVMGDGEQQEGNIWEAVMTAGHYKLDNLCGIVDKNELQIDGWVKEVMNVDPLADKYRAFNWHVIEIDGHDMGQILDAFAEARTIRGKPTVIIAKTVKGKSVSFMENEASWHGIATKTEEQFEKAIKDIACPTFPFEKARKLIDVTKKYQEEQQQKLDQELPKFSRSYWWNDEDEMKVEMDPTRFGFGRCLNKIGDDERIVTIHADISGSIKITDFEKDHPERLNRVFSVGIAEQNMMVVAAGLANEGKIPITGTYGVFASGRPWDQIRTTICYDNLSVKIAGAHGGVSVGPDGATHQALEEIALMSILPNMHVFVPCDAMETERLSKIAILDVQGPAYIRFAR